MNVRRKRIASLVEQLLVKNHVRHAPVDVRAIAVAEGVQVQEQPVEDQLSGFLLRDAGTRRAVIGVNSSHHANRRRFSLAHELGHFLLHDNETVHVDRTERDHGLRIRRRDEVSSAGTDIAEREANLFAAELLMPARFLEQDVADHIGEDILDEQVLRALARKYGVSAQALAFRLANLGYVQL